MHTKKRTPKAVKQLRGPAYVAHLEGKIEELQAKLKVSSESSSDAEQPALDGRQGRDRFSSSSSTPEISLEDTCTDYSASSRGPAKHELLDDKIPPPLVDVNGTFEFGTENPFQTHLSSPIAENKGMVQSRKDTLWSQPELESSIGHPGFDDSFAIDWTNTELQPPPLPNVLPVHLHPVSLNPQGLVKAELYGAPGKGFLGQETLKQQTLEGLEVGEEQILPGLTSSGHDDVRKSIHTSPSPLRSTQSPASSTGRGRSRSSQEGNRNKVQHRERNRLAAAKTRTKKRAAKEKLQEDARIAEARNTYLSKQVLELRQQRAHLRELALQHDIRPSLSCQCSQIHKYNMGTLQEALYQKT
ncbi:hypothetical protein PRZ48_002492 [Zasmidium cellare]|uniref:BZIP domain-containing protein n=1 Tax=Zasmidium cellare TaxID=395010 RepID=A0ABR0F6J4_ZASCE|nr:hypothetical protein PRZ48_002492 [Zasmidium cellare]